MTPKEIMTKAFDDRIDLLFKEKNSEIWRWLKNHERKNLCIENLCKEVFNEELLKGSKRLDKEKLEFLGRSYADTFSNLALRKAEEDAVSQMERSRRIREAEEDAEFAKMFNEEVDQDGN